MGQLGLKALDIAFFVFHTALVLFNLLGWIWPKTRRWNLYTLLATATSWFLMGIWYGIGYCLCTDWHFQIRRQLGYQDESPTYIHLMIKLMTGADLDPALVQAGTAAGFVLALICSIVANCKFPRTADPQPGSA
jgi:hypothetical protein